MLAPFLVKKIRTIFLACWLLWIVLYAAVLSRLGVSNLIAGVDSSICNTVLFAACLLISNTFRYYLPRQNRYGYFFALCVVLTLLWLGICKLFLYFLFRHNVGYNQFFSQSVPVRSIIAFLVIGCMILFCVLWYTLQERNDNERRKTEMEKLAKDAELYKLRQQLQPHFLFNSLNSINALIGFQPEQARTMIQQLSDFLRSTLKKEDSHWASLEDELTHLQLYLEIEKIRFGHRLQTIIERADDSGLLKIPPMLLQPVVENAIKFGLYDTTGQITISIYTSMLNGNLIVKVQNPFDPNTTPLKSGTGFGLNSIKRRLYLVFAQQNLLKTKVDDNIFTTEITIPQL